MDPSDRSHPRSWLTSLSSSYRSSVVTDPPQITDTVRELFQSMPTSLFTTDYRNMCQKRRHRFTTDYRYSSRTLSKYANVSFHHKLSKYVWKETSQIHHRLPIQFANSFKVCQRLFSPQIIEICVKRDVTDSPQITDPVRELFQFTPTSLFTTKYRNMCQKRRMHTETSLNILKRVRELCSVCLFWHRWSLLFKVSFQNAYVSFDIRGAYCVHQFAHQFAQVERTLAPLMSEETYAHWKET